MKIYDLINENIVFLYFFAWSCCTVCIDSLTKTLDGSVSTLFHSTFSLPLQNLSLVFSSSFFSSLALLELGFCGD